MREFVRARVRGKFAVQVRASSQQFAWFAAKTVRQLFFASVVPTNLVATTTHTDRMHDRMSVFVSIHGGLGVLVTGIFVNTR